MTDFPFVVVEVIGRWAGIVANVLLAFDRTSVVTAKGISIVLHFLFRIFVFALLNIVDYCIIDSVSLLYYYS